MNTKSRKNSHFRFLRFLLVWLLFWLNIAGFGQDEINERDLVELVDKVIGERFTEVLSLSLCAFTQQTTITDVGNVRERFDPSFGLGLEWQLLMVNGQDPTDQQLNDYKPRSRKRHPALLNFDFIDINSVQLMSQSPSKLQFTFKVLPGESTGLNQHVVNHLTIDRLTERLIELKSYAPEPFHIEPWMHVTEYKSVSTFRFEEQTNSSVLEQVSFKLNVNSAKQMLEQEFTKYYSNFDCSKQGDNETSMDANHSIPLDVKGLPVPLDVAPNSGDTINR